MTRVLQSLCGLALGAIMGSAYAMTYQDDIGYVALQDLLGSDTPTGSGVRVAHVEAAGSDGAWKPDTGSMEFAGKTFNLIDAGIVHPPTPSGHATGVGTSFYGVTGSIAPGITAIDVYLADHWLGGGFLGVGGDAQPLVAGYRVGNHSYVGYDENGNDSSILRRLDWVIETDDVIQVVGMNNGAVNQPLLGSAFNAISVGKTDGNHAQGGVVLDAPYGAGRTRPDLVAPRGTTSGATPVVAAAAALLVETGAEGALTLSHGSTVNRAGDVIYNAERSETIKAALMAGADRLTGNQSTAANISDYRATPQLRSENGLDTRFGAGQLNILNSYRIVAAGEQDSLEDNPAAGSIFWQGFDFDESFGGLNDSNATATYAFTAEAGHEWLTASLVWNLDVDGGIAEAFDGSASLFDLDLELWSNNGTVDAGDDFLFGYSAGISDNSENLWLGLVAGHSYELRVLLGQDQDPIAWDYALAWQIAPAPVPLPATWWLLGSALVAMARLAPSRPGCRKPLQLRITCSALFGVLFG
jgi:hypothetical protein